MTTGSSSPGTTGWLYRRRMSFRVVPCATSVCRSRRAWAYSVACHSGEVSSGMPAFSHRTYARMPTRSSGISTRETSTSGTRSPGGRGGSSARGAEENIARNGHRADRRRSGRARGRDVLPVEVARTATDVRLACARGATGGRRSRAAAPRAGRTHAPGAFSAAAAAPAILKRLFRSQAAGGGGIGRDAGATSGSECGEARGGRYRAERRAEDSSRGS